MNDLLTRTEQQINTDAALQEPLVYTSKGNIPSALLGYKTYFVDNQILLLKGINEDEGVLVAEIEKDGHIEFIEEYYLGDELVKRAVHIIKFKGLGISPEQGGIH